LIYDLRDILAVRISEKWQGWRAALSGRRSAASLPKITPNLQFAD